MTTQSLFLQICLAIFGGFIVFVGLLMEKLWAKKSYKNTCDFKWSKRMVEVGAWLVIAGIVFEIGVAVWTASDAWETRQMAIKNDPNNLPVSDISATVVVKLEGTNFERINETFDLRLDNWVTLLDNKTNVPTLNLGNMGSLMAEDVLPFINSNFQDRSVVSHGYVMKYVENPLNAFDTETQLPIPEHRPVAKYVLEKVRFLRIIPSFIPKNTQVIGGEAWLTINGTLRRKFIIYRQGMDTNFQEWNPNFKSLVFLATNSIPEK